MIVLGIDPGSRITGYGVIRVEKTKSYYVSSGCVRMTQESIPERLQQIFSGLREVMVQFQPEEIAIEQVFMHQNPGSALKLGQARGAAIVAATLDGLSVSEYSAKQVKQAVVGYGSASKGQVQLMVRTLLGLSDNPQSDAADALAVALCHVNTQNGLGYLNDKKR